MPMGVQLVGVTGTHGSGKTTLCKAVSGYPGIAFERTTTSEVFKRLGKTPNVAMSLDERLDVQEEILRVMDEQWTEALVKHQNNAKIHTVITDRTPYCMITFMLAEISGYGELTEEQNQRVMRYVESCREAGCMFDMNLYVPMSFYSLNEAEKVRASMGRAYREHYDLLLWGALRGTQHYTLHGEDLQHRVHQSVSLIETNRLLIESHLSSAS